MAGRSDFELEAQVDIKGALDALKEVSPKLATEARRALRESGKAITEEQGRILDSERGGNVLRTHYKARAGLRQGRGGYRRGPSVALYGGMVIDRVDSVEASRSRGRGARREIKAGLKTRVSTPKTGAKVRIATTKGDLRKAMNTRKWRHPIFADAGMRQGTWDGAWVEQAGTQYFRRGISEKYQETREALFRAVEDMTNKIT